MDTLSYSLHIGLNQVDPNHYQGWKGQLFCCENDALFYHEIAQKAGFTESKLMLTSGSSNALLPTSENLNQYLEEKSNEMNAGDFLFISYSGHGGVIQDFNFDEPDFQDETWCLYDRQYIDDELWRHFSNFKKGVRIFIISDSCHSGSVARMIESDKDKEVIGLINDIYKKMNLVTRNAPKDVTYPTYMAHKEMYSKVVNGPVVMKEEIAATVLQLGACQDNEKAAEWDGFGLFTSVVKKVLETNRDIESYEALFSKIKTQIPAIQQPNLFTYGADMNMFLKEKLFQVNKGKGVSFFNPAQNKVTTANPDEGLIVEIEAGEIKSREGLRPAGIVTRGTNAPANYFLKDAQADIVNAWDQAYREYFKLKKEEEADVFVEPNIHSKFLKETPTVQRSANPKDDYMSGWPKPSDTLGAEEFIWHLDNNHSQLKKARERVLEKLATYSEADKLKYNPTIRIAHIDTGYIPSHPATPRLVLSDLAISYVNGEDDNKGIDIFENRIKMLEQDGHGSATLAILAGDTIGKNDSYAGYEGEFGGIPFAEVIPVRICDTVYNAFNANDVARGIEYAIENGCEVITMSMAGYPTRRVAKAINKAYNAGVVIVTAAGNNWTKGISSITPKAIMYPAHFDRVIAACGVCYNEKPYDFDANKAMKLRSEGGDTMQGNWGPERAMLTALAAYTPNLAWANNNPKNDYRFTRTGGGTSSATPQIAAAAALWILFNRKELTDKEFAGTWQQAEAVRQALFKSGGKKYPGYKKYYGNGSLKASDALDISGEILNAALKPAKEAKVNLLGIGQFIGQWFRDKRSGEETTAEADPPDDKLKEMVTLEIIQVMYKDSSLFEYIELLDLDGNDEAYLADPQSRDEFLARIKDSKYASDTLKAMLQ